MMRSTLNIFGALGLTFVLMSSQARAADEKTVTLEGMAEIVGSARDAKDSAINDALRNAVERVAGTVVSSQTLTENYQIVSDKIYSQSKGYVKTFKVLSERKDGGVYVVKVQATVSTADLKKDIDGIMALLQRKNMPRLLVMISEQNVGDAGPNFWWGKEARTASMDAAENGLMEQLLPKGVRFVDRQALSGRISAAPAAAEPSAHEVKSFAVGTGAEVVLVGKAIATSAGQIMGTPMKSIQATVSLRAINVDNGEILATSTLKKVVGNVDLNVGGTKALKELGMKAADDIFGKILARWTKDVNGPQTYKVTAKGFKKSRDARKLIDALKTGVEGVKQVRRRSYKKGVAELEVVMEGTVYELGDALELKKFPGFQVELEEITSNTLVINISK